MYNCNVNSYVFAVDPFLPGKMTGCLEDSLQGYKIKLHDQRMDRQAWIDLYSEWCNVKLTLQSNTQKICLRQTRPKTDDVYYCRIRIDNYQPVWIKFGSYFTLVRSSNILFFYKYRLSL